MGKAKTERDKKRKEERKENKKMITTKEGTMEATLLGLIRSSPFFFFFFCIMPSFCAFFSTIASSAPTKLPSPSLPLSTSLNRALAADASVKVLREKMGKNGVVGGGNLQSAYYISHGSPMMPLEDTPARNFLQQLPKSISQRPKAILIISAHWDTQEPTVNAVNRNATIHDFYGFPPALYQLQYTPPGSTGLARRVRELLQIAGFQTVKEDKERGLDHGAWVPLSLMFREADIPVCQLSIQSRKGANHHYQLGRALAPLKAEGVLIVASGSAIHNLRELDFSGSTKPVLWAKTFIDWLTDALVNNRHEDLMQWEKAPYARRAHPTPDHFVPLFVALGAGGEDSYAELIHSSWDRGISMASFAFHPLASKAKS